MITLPDSDLEKVSLRALNVNKYYAIEV